MRPFTWNPSAARVIFGAGSLERLADELDRLGARAALMLSTPGRAVQAEAISAGLGAQSVGVYAGAVMHVPIEIARDARRIAAERHAGSCVGIGGGSAIRLATAIGVGTRLP